MNATSRNRQKKADIRAAALKRKFLEVFPEAKGNTTKTCETIHLRRQTLYAWLKEDQVFKEAVDDAYEAVIDHVEDKLHFLIDHNEPSAVYFFLKCKAKKRGYVERQEHTGADGGPIETRLSMTDLRSSMKGAQE